MAMRCAGFRLCTVVLGLLMGAAVAAAGAPPPFPGWPSPEEWRRIQVLNGEDHANMMAQLGITRLRPGRNASSAPGTPNPANYDEAKANPYPNYPDALTFPDGRKVTTTAAWWAERRPQIVKAFETQVYGRVPAHIPGITWSVVQSKDATLGGVPVLAQRVVGTVDNAADPKIAVKIRLAVVRPAHARRVPVLIMFGFGTMPGDPVPQFGSPGQVPQGPPSTDQLVADGWGYVSLDANSIQPDNGAGLTRGIIGLVNRGRRRTPEDWGALRAWAWGASRVLDYLGRDPAFDARRVGVEGVSRFGKAALVTMAFDQRFAAALIGSSGAGGAAPFRRNFGEALENLASSGEYHWMAGNFLKYAAAESKFGSLTANDLPVDSNELIALCAPRPVFISYGIPASGDPGWVDQQGSYMAAVAAGPVYRLLGAKDLGDGRDYREAVLPPAGTGLLAGQLAWRQHHGGHEDRSNMKYFIAWADRMLGRR